MDSSERLAERYLRSLKLGRVLYEPQPNAPPDFLVDGRIAVEVRRLNQNHVHGDSYQGLEQGAAAVVRWAQTKLPDYGPALNGEGWWVFFHFRRPMDWRSIKRGLPKAFRAFQARPSPAGVTLMITPTFELEIAPASILVAHQFMFGGYSDRDAGGFVVAEIIRNLKLCIAEKTAKIAPGRGRYPEWWLVLPDHIGPDLDINERQLVRDHVERGEWDRIVLLHPRDPASALVI